MINELISKARAILTSVVTIAAALAVAATEIASAADVPIVGEVAGRVAVFLFATIAIIRRVTPVPVNERGLV